MHCPWANVGCVRGVGRRPTGWMHCPRGKCRVCEGCGEAHWMDALSHKDPGWFVFASAELCHPALQKPEVWASIRTNASASASTQTQAPQHPQERKHRVQTRLCPRAHTGCVRSLICWQQACVDAQPRACARACLGGRAVPPP
eukprot:351144-Chlamydomonas_euryale.AAC.4